MPTLEQFKNARSVLKGVIRETSLIDSPALSKGCGNRVYLKPENMQVTGAYKIRGAYYKISTLTQEQRERGLVTASAGNHAQGVAFAAHSHGIPATIVMPKAAPIAKVQATEGYGARVVLCGDCYDDAKFVADYIRERSAIQDIIINYVGPVIGSHTGPGVVSVFFLGTER